MIFDNLPDDLEEGDSTEVVIRRFRELRARIFKIVPEPCFLKSVKALSGEMTVLLDISAIDRGLIRKEDICSLCPQETCPYNYVKDREDRKIKLKLLNQDLKPN